MEWYKTKTQRLFRSPHFFRVTLLLFVIESVWIAISATYPMVFDENTHFAIIKLYARQWSPFFAHQPAGSDYLGALPHNPSFLYEYLLSFPYHLLEHLTDNQMLQIIGLRLINVALFAVALILFRQLLLRFKTGSGLTNLILFVFVLIPVIPLLAGQINYDNLAMLFAAASLLLAVQWIERLRAGQLAPGKFLLLLSVGMLGSMVQFELLPFFVGIVLWLAWEAWRAWRKALPWRNELKAGMRELSWPRRLLIGGLFTISIGLFTAIYGINMVTYHTPDPACNQILSSQACALNSTWERNQVDQQTKTAVNGNPVLFAGGWSYRLLVSMFYTSSGGAPKAYYLSVNPMPTIFVTTILVMVIGTVLAVIYWRQVLAHSWQLVFALFVATFYAASLFAHNYAAYLDTGQKIGINGRYLFPVLLPYMVLLSLAYRQWLKRRPGTQLVMVGAVCLLILQGGGALTYILDSNPNWYWQHDQVALRLNQAAQAVFKPVVILKSPLNEVRSFGSAQEPN